MITLNGIEKYLLNGIIQPGDIINWSTHPGIAQPQYAFANLFIRGAQWAKFKNPNMIKKNNKVYCSNNDTHSMIYFSNEMIEKYIGDRVRAKVKDYGFAMDTFSVEPPFATLVSSSEWVDGDITVYRDTTKEMTEEDIKVMLEAALKILGTPYDVGQLIDMLIGDICGYPEQVYSDSFDFGKKDLVCSVGVNSVFTSRRHYWKEKGIILPRYFSKLNPDNWDPAFVEQFNIEDKNKWSVERTHPTMFGLYGSHFLGNCIETVLRIDGGKVIYQKS